MKTKILPIVAITVCSALFSCTNNTSTQTKTQTATDTTAHKPAGESIYQLEGKWVTQDNKTITLANLKGKVQVMAMVFTHCKSACPRIVGDIKSIEKSLPASLKSKVGFTLVTFDVARDTVGRLKEFATEMNLDSNWTLLHGNDDEVRQLSMLLNVNYEKMDNGDFNHTSVISILDQNGVIIHRHEGLEMDTTEMVQKITSLVK